MRASSWKRSADGWVLAFHPPWKGELWHLYDDLKGRTLLRFPLSCTLETLIVPPREWRPVPCYSCGAHLRFVKYRAHCCGEEYKINFGDVTRIREWGTHDRTSGRGWNSLRLAIQYTEG